MSEGEPLDAALTPVPLPLARPLAAESELPGPPPSLSGPAARSRVCACRPVSWDRKGAEGGQGGRSPYFTHFPRVCLGVNQRPVVTGDPPALSRQLPLQRRPHPLLGRCSGVDTVLPRSGGTWVRGCRPSRSRLGSPEGVGPKRSGVAPPDSRSGVTHRRLPAAARVTCPGGRGQELSG